MQQNKEIFDIIITTQQDPLSATGIILGLAGAVLMLVDAVIFWQRAKSAKTQTDPNAMTLMGKISAALMIVGTIIIVTNPPEYDRDCDATAHELNYSASAAC